MTFSPVTERRLILVRPDGYESEIYVAVGSPYTQAAAPEMAEYAACQILTCDDTDLTTEVYGKDSLEALVAALEFIELFLFRLIENTRGELRYPDGRSFDPRGSVLLQQSRHYLQKKRDRA
jgi:hypothetical protein